MKTKSLFLFIFLLLGFTSSSLSQVGLNLGNEYGLGLMVQLGTPKIKLEFGGGLTPLFVSWQITDIRGSNDETYFKFYFSGTFGSKINFALSNPEKDRLGLKLGISYDTIMKTGFGAGIDYNISQKPKNIVISGGFMIYPKAYDELLNRLNDEEGTNYSNEDVSAVLINFRPFVGLTIFFGE
jgi:hypothetical protein